MQLIQRNTRQADTAIRQAAIASRPELPWYPWGHPELQQHGDLYSLRISPCRTTRFGRLRAGAKIFSCSSGTCLACGNAGGSISHVLRRCNSTLACLNKWLQHMPLTEGLRRMSLGDDEFTAKIFDFSSFESVALQRATVTFVWDATAAARRTAIGRWDAY